MSRGVSPQERRAMREVLQEIEVREGLEAGREVAEHIEGMVGPWADAIDREHRKQFFYSDELAARICERIAAGELLIEIHRTPGLPKRDTIHFWRKTNPVFAKAFDRAREIALSRYGEAVGDKTDADLAKEICDRIEAGETLQSICSDPAMPSVKVLNQWKRDRPDFLASYNRAREASAEACEHNAIREVELAHDRESASVAKVRAETWRWVASVRNPKTHGNKLDATVSIEIGLADRLNAAMARVIVGNVIEGELLGDQKALGDGSGSTSSEK